MTVSKVKRSEKLTVFATFLTIAGADSFYGTEEKVGCFMPINKHGGTMTWWCGSL
jgi:hypothetical protein